MKTIRLFAFTLAIALSIGMSAQASEIYDKSYQGPMNIYGQPALIVPQNPQGQNQAQTSPQGLLPKTADGLYQIGEYFWSYMPAPVRGAQSPYAVPPGSGQVSTSFVPGTP